MDIVFAPLLERVLASVYFYKGLDVKKEYSAIARWFTAMERRETYAGTQSDFITHVHALPPLVGACVENRKDGQAISANRVRALRYRALPESAVPEPSTSVTEAITRVVRHHESMIATNLCAQTAAEKSELDVALRCVLTALVTGEDVPPPAGAAAALLRTQLNNIK